MEATKLLYVLAATAVIAGGVWLGDRLLPGWLADELPKADRIVIDKSARTLSLFGGARLIRSYPIQLGGNPAGHKQFEGDSRTPEGDYTIDWRNPRSRFYRSLHISYPNPDDARRARAQGRDPGGDIMIHGVPNGLSALSAYFAGRDWTDGCVAVSNIAMEEIWHAVDDGTPVRIDG